MYLALDALQDQPEIGQPFQQKDVNYSLHKDEKGQVIRLWRKNLYLTTMSSRTIVASYLKEN